MIYEHKKNSLIIVLLFFVSVRKDLSLIGKNNFQSKHQMFTTN